MINAREPSNRPMLQDVGNLTIQRDLFSTHARDQCHGKLAYEVLGRKGVEE